MWMHKICGSVLSSNVPIPELEITSAEQPELTFRLYSHSKEFPASWVWLNYWYLSDGEIWLAFAKLGAMYLLQFPELANFVVSIDAHTISCYPQEDIPWPTVRHLLLNQVIPIVLAHLGKTVLHASACAMPRGVVAFMGASGTGKSTLSASLGLRGYPVVTDDCLLIEEHDGVIMSYTSYPGSRLWPESVAALLAEDPQLQPLAYYTDKRRLVYKQSPLSSPNLLSSVYILTQPEKTTQTAEVEIIPLAASEAFLECIKHTFQLDITDRARLEGSFRQFEHLVKSVPFFRLTYRHDFALLPTLHNVIENHLI